MQLWIVLSVFLAATPGKTKQRCKEPLEVGNGRFSITRYYYHAKDRQCLKFQWKGGKDNRNNFLSFQDCYSTCHPCLKRVEPGPCNGTITRYYFSWKQNKCMNFTWGGCKANANNFATNYECRLNCCIHGCSDKACSQPLDEGEWGCYEISDGYSDRFYYSNETKKCKKFTYTGCQGNQNNFKTRGDCRKMCKWM